MAGVVVGLGLAWGVTPGTVPAFVAGVALITTGRRPDIRTSLSVALLAVALGIGGLRWSTVDLQEIFGIQEVLGPALLVGPEVSAVACGLAAAAALAALTIWSAREPGPLLVIPGAVGRWSARAWTCIETWVLATGIASIFFRPASPNLAPLPPIVLTGVALGLALLLRRSRPVYSWAVLALALAGVLVAAALLVEAG